MANLWVGTDYYIPSIDSSGDTFIVTVNSTTTSNTHSVSTDKNVPAMNTEAVGSAAIVWLKDFGWATDYDFGTHEDDSRRTTIAPSSTASENGTGLEVEYAIAANGFCNSIYNDNFDQMIQANNNVYHIKVGGSGWQEQDEITFTNISGGYPEGSSIEKINNFTGNIIWTDKNGPCFYTGTSEVDLASNATFIVNAAIRAGNWTP